ncbi:hypothetical protein H2200_008506 [Cladophialophora chaetospira]|uniref:F-box domain-containing protein n=1 Tax=Cladophialophora chaetospira TaxID=386627 RepID=A0AA39CGN8_9EURO|nr:hypothetical protein H2200_008506 [Cladophialophora chaetospira]
MPKIKKSRPKHGAKRLRRSSTAETGAAASSVQPQIVRKTSRFLDLPVEIRLRIYAFLVEPYLDRETTLKLTPTERRTEMQPLLSVCRQVSEEWVPFFYSATWMVNDLFRKPSDLDTLYLKTLDTYKARNIQRIAHNATSEDRRRPKFSEAKTFASVISKYKTGLESLDTVSMIAAHSNMLFYTWGGTLTKDPERTAEKLWQRSLWSPEWDALARTLQGKTRSGVFQGWDLTKYIAVSTCINMRGERVYRPIGANLEWTKPNSHVNTTDDGVTNVAYKLVVVEAESG